MLSDNTNKMLWIGIALGIVTIVGVGGSALFPDAIDNGQALIVEEVRQFTGSRDVDENTNYTWSYSGNTATVTGFAEGKRVKDVAIPDFRVYNGRTYKVTAVADNAFSYNTAPNVSQITSVSLGVYVSKIGNYAFVGNKLDSIKLPDSVTSIGNSAFGYSGLNSVTFGKGLKTVDQYAFVSNNLTTVELPKGVDSLGFASFAGSNITKVTMSKSTQLNGDFVFTSSPEITYY